MTYRRLSPEEKRHIVRQLLSGEKYLSQLSREYHISHSAITKWRQAYQSKGEAAFGSAANESQEPTIAALQARVAELERFCGQLALENDVLKKALHLLPSHSGTS